MALAFDTANVDSVINAAKNFGVEVNYVKGKGEIIESSNGTRKEKGGQAALMFDQFTAGTP
jgi:hypothetical protein